MTNGTRVKRVPMTPPTPSASVVTTWGLVDRLKTEPVFASMPRATQEAVTRNGHAVLDSTRVTRNGRAGTQNPSQASGQGGEGPG